MKWLKNYINRQIIKILSDNNIIENEVNRRLIAFLDTIELIDRVQRGVDWTDKTEMEIITSRMNWKEVSPDKIRKFLRMFDTIIEKRAKYELEKIKSAESEMRQLRCDVKNVIRSETIGHIDSEEFIDVIVERIKRKQL